MRSIGIDIGTSSIKVVEALSTNKGTQIVSFTEHALGNNPAYDPELEIVEFLQSLSQLTDASQTKVVMALRQERVSVRHKIFPFPDRLKILKSLPFELEEDIPFSSETAVYEARTVRFIGSTAEVLACATPKHRVQEMLDKYQSSGLAISTLSVEGLAFSNCFENWNNPIPQEPPRPLGLEDADLPLRSLKLIVQLGHTHTIVSAFDGGELVGVRSILWGGKNVAEAISRKYEIPYVEALREMRTKAFILPSKENASYDQIVFSDTISTQFREFGRELKLSVLEFETELNGKILSAEVTGGLAGILNVPAFMTQLLEVPVNIASFLGMYPTSFEKTPAIENTIGTALGLAIEGLRKPRNPGLQFLRGEFAPQNESLQILWETWGLTAKVVVSMLVILFVYSSTRESLSSSLLEHTQDVLKDQAKTIAKLPAKMANENGVKKYIKDKQNRAKEMKALEGLSHMNSALDIMKKISDASPARTAGTLVVRSLRIEDQTVSIEGMIGNARDKTVLQSALAAISRDGKVTAQNGTPVPGVLGVPFAFSFAVERGVEK